MNDFSDRFLTDSNLHRRNKRKNFGLKMCVLAPVRSLYLPRVKFLHLKNSFFVRVQGRICGFSPSCALYQRARIISPPRCKAARGLIKILVSMIIYPRRQCLFKNISFSFFWSTHVVFFCKAATIVPTTHLPTLLEIKIFPWIA